MATYVHIFHVLKIPCNICLVKLIYEKMCNMYEKCDRLRDWMFNLKRKEKKKEQM